MAEGLWSGVGAGDQSHGGVDGDHGGAAVADQRQGQADNGHNADAHAHVDQHLEHHGGGRTIADQAAHIVRAAGTDLDAPGDDGKLQQDHAQAAEEAQLLTHGGEDVVRMLGEQVAILGTGAVEQALARQAAAGEGLQVDLAVVAGADAHLVKFRVDQDADALLLIGAQTRP